MAQLRVTSKALPEHNRHQNRSLVLQTLFHRGPMSRADLARESGLTRVTVSDLVSELSGEGLITELGPRAGAHVGKPAQLIELNENAYHVISLDLSAADRFIGAIVDLRGRIVHRAEVALDDAHGDHALQKAIDLTQTLIKRSTVRLLGIGIGTPGVVDHGVVRQAPNLGWYDLPLAQRFVDRFGVAVHVCNDANAGALAIHTFQKTTGSSLLLVTIEHGVGAGLIVDGALVEGEQFMAGEIGHVVVDVDGERCSCGRQGCLELAIAVPYLARRLDEASAEEKTTVLADAGRALAVALAPIVAVLNLNEVLLAGPAELVEGPFLDAAECTVRERTLSAANNGLTMRLADESHNVVLLGAAVLVLSAELGVS